ncbi:MAG: alpha/beta fold hydrolase [Desertimonas sp.]
MILDHERHGTHGAPVVLVHGITESRRTWDPILDRLGRDHRVLALDLPGHGGSPPAADGDALTLAAAVHDTVTHVGFDDPTLIGHSFGGVVVTAYAAAFGATRVVNIDQSLRLGDFQAALQAAEPQLRGTPGEFTALIAALFESMDGPLPASERARIDATARVDQDVVLGIWASTLSSTPDELDALVGALTAPVTARYLSIHGIDPGPGYDAWLAERIDGAVIEHWPEHGHYPHLVDPDRFVTRVGAFIDG